MPFPKLELLPGQLYFEIRPPRAQPEPGCVYFTTCMRYPHMPQSAELGPINVSQALKAFAVLQSMLSRAQASGEAAVYQVPCVAQHIITGASTVGLFLVFFLNFDGAVVSRAFAPLWRALRDDSGAVSQGAVFQRCSCGKGAARLGHRVRKGNAALRSVAGALEAFGGHILSKKLSCEQISFENQSPGLQPGASRAGGVDSAFEAFMLAAWRAQHLSAFSVRDFSPQIYDFYIQPQNGQFVELLHQRLFGFVISFDCGLKPGSFCQLLKTAGVEHVLCAENVFYAKNDPAHDFGGVETRQFRFKTFPSAEQLQTLYRFFANEQKPFAICSTSGLGYAAVVLCVLLVKFFRFSAPQAVCWARSLAGDVLDADAVAQFEKYCAGLQDEHFQRLGDTDACTQEQSQQLGQSPPRRVESCLQPTVGQSAVCQAEQAALKAESDALENRTEIEAYQFLNSQKINELATRFINFSSSQARRQMAETPATPKLAQLQPCRYIIKNGQVVEVRKLKKAARTAAQGVKQ